MRISEVIAKLEAIKEEEGDLHFLGIGHPGEVGSEIDDDCFEVRTEIYPKKERILFLAW